MFIKLTYFIWLYLTIKGLPASPYSANIKLLSLCSVSALIYRNIIKGFPIRVICFEIEKKTLNIHSELIEIFFIILDILCHL